MLCEGASLLEALHYKGIATKQNLMTFVKSMPVSPNNNPNNGFSGEWRHNVNGTYQGMNPTPVVKWGNKNGGKLVNQTGATVQTLKNEVANQNPVMVWVTYAFEPAEHKHLFGVMRFGIAMLLLWMVIKMVFIMSLIRLRASWITAKKL